MNTTNQISTCPTFRHTSSMLGKKTAQCRPARQTQESATLQLPCSTSLAASAARSLAMRNTITNLGKIFNGWNQPRLGSASRSQPVLSKPPLHKLNQIHLRLLLTCLSFRNIYLTPEQEIVSTDSDDSADSSNPQEDDHDATCENLKARQHQLLDSVTEQLRDGRLMLDGMLDKLRELRSLVPKLDPEQQQALHQVIDGLPNSSAAPASALEKRAEIPTSRLQRHEGAEPCHLFMARAVAGNAYDKTHLHPQWRPRRVADATSNSVTADRVTYPARRRCKSTIWRLADDTNRESPS
ncbi:hypothetical protein B0I35DRAFT_46197 [Stachybotrys elegans]|uniref:Uncharacterized protein n=1 Tax=Stachybotrys elegans TaxID=80388 RepID=A0A8K0T3F1_9HYPO|nr:hypothetical protein B0I35DRAFT_46197 [Stachybotrys elegans]